MNWLWISGWAVPPAWFAEQARVAWPKGEHRVVSPSAAAAALARNDFEALGGFSLGALWLLKNAGAVPKNIPVVLLAPIFSFPSEAGHGGRIALAQLRLQRRRLRADAESAVADFFRRAGLEDVSRSGDSTAGQIAALDAELGWLEDWHAPLPVPEGWRGFIGDNDALLEAVRIRELWPKIQIIPGATHAPVALLRAAARAFEK